MAGAVAVQLNQGLQLSLDPGTTAATASVAPASSAIEARRYPAMTVHAAIIAAEQLLPGEPAPDGEADLRWQAIIEVADHIESDPDAVWQFAARWGTHQQDDLRMAIATVVLEHLLEYHFDLIFPRVETLARRDPNFADTFSSCWKFGQSKLPANAAEFDRLKGEITTGCS